MGLFKNIKDMKQTVKDAPGMVAQAQQMAASAQAMQAAQMAQAQQAAAMAPTGATMGGVLSEADLAPIAGVDLATYAQICKAIVPLNYDQSALPGLAAARGIDAASWQAAVDGWSARMTANPAVGTEFRRHYDAA